MATYNFDIIVYGASEAGIFAAIAAKQVHPSASVVLLMPTANIDNYSTNGLGKADIGKSWLVAGLYLDALGQANGQLYGKSKQWPFGSRRIEYFFRRLLGKAGVIVIPSERIARPGGVAKSGTAITGLTMESGNVYTASRYIDASYMGDVMTQALTKNVGWRIGREASSLYSESINGFQPQVITNAANPYSSGSTLWRGATPYPTGRAPGAADDYIQCPGVRTLVSNSAQNMLSWSRIQSFYLPDDYDTAHYGLDTQLDSVSGTFRPYPVEVAKFDDNDNTIVTDGSGRPIHFDYAEASYATRDTIDATIRDHVLGRFVYYATHASRAGTFQTELLRFGLCRDEFSSATNFMPRMIYHREGPRLIGEYVMKQSDAQTDNTKANSIACLTYSMDIHQCAYLVNPATAGTILKEGLTTQNDDIHEDGAAVPYTAILPQSAQCTNLLVPYCGSTTHATWASWRIISANAQIGEASGVAAALSLNRSETLHALDITALRTALVDRNCVIDPFPNPGGDGDDDDGGDDEVGG